MLFLLVVVICVYLIIRLGKETYVASNSTDSEPCDHTAAPMCNRPPTTMTIRGCTIHEGAVVTQTVRNVRASGSGKVSVVMDSCDGDYVTSVVARDGETTVNGQSFMGSDIRVHNRDVYIDGELRHRLN